MYITIDGDDIGQRITRFYLDNDEKSLSNLNKQMIETTHKIAEYLKTIGFSVIFCGADGVAGHIETCPLPEDEIFKEISVIGQGCATFSAGYGKTLRESYFALIAAKSHGKAQIFNYQDLGHQCSE